MTLIPAKVEHKIHHIAANATRMDINALVQFSLHEC